MNHYDEIDHDEHAAVRADIAAEQAAEDPRGARLRSLTDQIDEIRHITDLSDAAIDAAAEHDRPDDAEHELVALERHMKEIFDLTLEVLTILASGSDPDPETAVIDGVTYSVVDVITIPVEES